MRFFYWFIVSFNLFSCLPGQRSKGGLEALSELSLQRAEAGLRPKKWALLVGINSFSDKRWPQLRYAVADAQALGQLLNQGGDFDEVKVLTAPADTNRAEIVRSLDWLSEKNTSPDDTVVVYFSTHGTLDRGRGGLARYLVTADSKQDDIQGTALSVAWLYERFDRLPSTRKVLILATCHSGSGKSVISQRLAGELRSRKGVTVFPPLMEVSQAAVVLTACAFGETAREDDSLGHDIYTAYLLEALSYADSDGDGAITVSEAHDWARHGTYAHSGGLQRPQMESSILGTDPIVLVGKRLRPARPVLFSFNPKLEGLQVEIDGQPKGRLPGRIVLESGSHRLTLREKDGTAFVSDKKIRLSQDREVTVESLLEQDCKRWTIQLRGGFQMFLDQQVRRTLIAPLALWGFSVDLRGWPLEPLDVQFDLSSGTSQQRLNVGGRSVPQTLWQLSYGLALLYRYRLGIFDFRGGANVSTLHLWRRGLEPPLSEQQYVNVSPGLVVELSLRVWRELFFSSEGRLNFFSVNTERENINLSYFSIFAGLGWIF